MTGVCQQQFKINFIADFIRRYDKRTIKLQEVLAPIVVYQIDIEEKESEMREIKVDTRSNVTRKNVSKIEYYYNDCILTLLL